MQVTQTDEIKEPLQSVSNSVLTNDVTKECLGESLTEFEKIRMMIKE